MASLKKRGKYYYARWQDTVDGKRKDVRKSLAIKYKKQAQQALKTLEKLEERGDINPYSKHFDPQAILENQQEKKQHYPVHNVREAADYFYDKKKHLSDKTVNVNASKPSEWGAYQRAVEHFITINDISSLPLKRVHLQHFENLIFKEDIKTPTRKFYYRQLKVFWNFFLDRDLVEENYLEQIDKDLPDDKENISSKMIDKKELKKIFKAFDQKIEKKNKLKQFHERYRQRWFKPMIATFFYGAFRKSEIAFNSGLGYSGLQHKNLQYIDDKLEMIHIEATKGRKERLVPISKGWKEYLLPYVKWRGELSDEDYIFVYKKKNSYWPVTDKQAYKEFKKYVKLAGLPSSRTLHGMRHRGITNWLEQGYSLKEGQLMAGHSSASVTEGYTHLVGRKLLDKQRKIDERDD